MSEKRRVEIASILRRRRLIAIEDRVYCFLKPTPPLAAFAKENVVQIDSLSKRLMPGMSLGIVACPPSIQPKVSRALRAGGWMASSLSVTLAKHWIDEGIVDEIEKSKRSDAREMCLIATNALKGLGYQSAPEALHG